MSEIPAKRQKTDHAKTIGTHNGTFHCDEALAVFLLKQTSTYRDADVKRSRDPAVLDTCDIVVDVGGIYDEAKKRFDHHQRGFGEVFGYDFTTKLSSAGLVYKHFGKEIISNHTQLPIDDEKIHTLWLKLYQQFIEGIDGIDNGVSQYPSDIEPKYRISTNLSSRVSYFNPPWNKSLDSAGMDKQFEKASALTGGEFLERLDYYANAWLPARELVIEAIEKSKSEVDPSGRILLFSTYLPWKEHLFNVEKDQSATYVLYPDESASAWRIQAVPVSSSSFESRKALPEAWRGLRDGELSEKSGVAGGIFVHASGFIGGNKSQEGALKLAQLALEM